MLGACSNDGTGPESNVAPGPGVPDWNSAAFDWIAEYDSTCASFRMTREFWSPKFGVTVKGVSKDGRSLLLLAPSGVELFDLASHTIRLVMPGQYSEARWSPDGQYIAVARAFPGPGFPLYAVYALNEDRSWDVPIPDSISAFHNVRWSDRDGMIQVPLIFPGDASANLYRVSVNAPNRIERVLEITGHPYEVMYAKDAVVAIVPAQDSSSALVDVAVGKKGQPDWAWSRHALHGVREVRDCWLSPAGHFLACLVDFDLSGSRFTRLARPVSTVSALAIVDLRAGSSDAFQIYSLFPDHSNRDRNCGLSWNSSVAWSPDERYLYHEQVRIADSTTQIVRRNITTGDLEVLSDFDQAP